jgi:hypothetical protein
VATLTIIARVFLYQFYRPVTHSDSGSYPRLAGQVQAGRKYYDRSRMPAILVLMTGTIWTTSLLHTLFEHCDDPRYSIPIQMLVNPVVYSWIPNLLNRNYYENHSA